MSKADGFENGLLKLIFQNDATGTTIAAIGSGLRNAVTAGSLQISLHTADPGDAGNQTTSEAAYSGYARIAVARNATNWTVTTNAVANAVAIGDSTWACTGGSATVTYFGVGTEATGTGYLLYSGQVSPSLAVSNGITPEFAIGDLDVTES
jgi:hypothetical protein